MTDGNEFVYFWGRKEQQRVDAKPLPFMLLPWANHVWSSYRWWTIMAR
jgi:hypothetical protein